MLWKGSQVPQEEDEEAVTKKAIKELEIFFSQIFYNFFQSISFFQLLYFITYILYFFTHDIYPHPHPRPTTSTHDPRPTTHDPRHLATLDLARAKSEALFNIYSFLEENIKSSNTKDRVKTTRTVKNNNNRSN